MNEKGKRRGNLLENEKKITTAGPPRLKERKKWVQQVIFLSFSKENEFPSPA